MARRSKDAAPFVWYGPGAANCSPREAIESAKTKPGLAGVTEDIKDFQGE